MYLVTISSRLRAAGWVIEIKGWAKQADAKVDKRLQWSWGHRFQWFKSTSPPCVFSCVFRFDLKTTAYCKDFKLYWLHENASLVTGKLDLWEFPFVFSWLVDWHQRGERVKQVFCPQTGITHHHTSPGWNFVVLGIIRYRERASPHPTISNPIHPTIHL